MLSLKWNQFFTVHVRMKPRYTQDSLEVMEILSIQNQELLWSMTIWSPECFFSPTLALRNKNILYKENDK